VSQQFVFERAAQQPDAGRALGRYARRRHRSGSERQAGGDLQ
jgi:hypothetical protein